ncbi:hypothetical protein KGF54_004551 [Candida jiufengensis]|uniref:uncharacterized protein n=1 Tax=Candida jiufengensis TaxID=497108 RepID=UPI0022243809|nr:uncharacterized protein KGF54_004551 [Candida jiufengensis]KAI5951477.1 hypothetical protein KGF54_004551 [Candida jiufengensis]
MVNYDSSLQIQALASSISKRLASETNSLLIGSIPTGRQAKRHAQQINYSEEIIDDFDFENTPVDSFMSNGSNTLNGLINNGFNNQRNLIESKTQVDVQKYGPARNTPKFKELEDESNIKNLIGKPEVLIPVKLNLETSNGNHKLNDIFMWNLNDSIITPQQFSEILCNDLELPNSMVSTIAESIQQQIDECSYASNLIIPHKNPCNIIIDLSVNLNKQLYQDRIEWDLNQNIVTPEQFAEIVCADLGLSLEFNLAISHALHEIIIRVKKEIIEGSFNNEIHNLHLVKGIVFENGLRIFTETSMSNGNDHWEPSVEVLSSSEIERREAERIRSLRRLKREHLKNDDKRRVGRRKNYINAANDSLTSPSNLISSQQLSPIRELNSIFFSTPSNPNISLFELSNDTNLLLKSPIEKVTQEHQQVQTNTSFNNDTQINDCGFMSFEEWKKQKVVEANNNHSTTSSSTKISPAASSSSNSSNIEVNKSSQKIEKDTTDKALSLTNITQIESEGKIYKDRFNFASIDCAATIVKTNSHAKGASAILKENKDTYLLNECSVSDKFVIIELCQDILVNSIVLGNYEFFSSMFKDIRVSVSDRYPTNNWRELGTFTAKNVRDVQLFQVENPLIWARYLKLDILSHYGNEFYCPISVLRVHGKTMIDDFKEDEEKSKQEQEQASQSIAQQETHEPEIDDSLLLDELNECRVSLPHLMLNEFLKELNTSQLCLPSENNGSAAQTSSSLSSSTASTITTQESIYKNIVKRLSLLEANATLSLLYIEEQSKLLSNAFASLERRQSINFNNLVSSMNTTLISQLFNFKDSYNHLYEQYNNLLKVQEKSHKLYLTDSAKKIQLLNSEIVTQKRMTIFNSIIVLCLLIYVILTRDINIEFQDMANNKSKKTNIPATDNNNVKLTPSQSHTQSITDQVVVPFNPKLHPKHKKSNP